MTEEKVKKKRDVPIPIKIGYSLGGAGDSIPYNLFFTYFLFFLTDVAGVSAGIAGTISFIAVLWDAVTDPAVGYLSDNSKNPNGRRRPWILRSIWPLAIVIFLLFVPNEFAGLAQTVYYILMAVLLWTFYTTYCVPFAALGAEITRDYNERNTIRMIVGLLSYPFVALCNSGPMWIIAWLTPRGMSIKGCWGIAGAVGGVVVIICCLICYFSTKGREDMEAAKLQASKPRENIFTTYKEMFKIKAYRNIIFVGIVYILGFTLFNSMGVYMLNYCANLDATHQATFWTIYTVFAICCTPLSIIFSNIVGSKKISLFVFSMVFCANAVVFYFVGLTSFVQVLIYGFFVAFSTSAFWSLYYSAVYDCCEIDNFVNGKKREGSVVAVAQFFQKAGGAVSTAAAGWMLTGFGYTGMGAESATTVNGILLMSTLIPAACIFISMIIFLGYPLNKKRHDALREAIEKKDKGEEYSDEGFKEIL